jgi:hypothetical protein
MTPSNKSNEERTMPLRQIAAAAAVSLCLAPLAQAQALQGTVTGAIYCCNAPIEADRATNLVTATIGPGVEFPNGVFTSIQPGLSPVPATIDIGGTTLDLHYLATAPAAPGAFDGYVFTFQGSPAIVSVTTDPASTLMPAAVTFTPNSIVINNAGLALTPESRLLLNVSTVPEPEKVGLLLAGLAAMTLFVRGRKRRSI